LCPKGLPSAKQGEAVGIRDELQGLMDEMAHAYRAGDASGCASLFLPDGALYSPYAPPALGRAAIEALHRDWTQSGGNKYLKVIDAGKGGNLGWCHTAFSEGEMSGNGTSLSVCERQADGRWLIRICMLNSDDPAPIT
jgi:ketosteroid isomerase-like protein